MQKRKIKRTHFFTNLNHRISSKTFNQLVLNGIEVILSMVLIVLVLKKELGNEQMPILIVFFIHGILSLYLIIKQKFNANIRLLFVLLIPIFLILENNSTVFFYQKSSFDITFWTTLFFQFYILLFSKSKEYIFYYFACAIALFLSRSFINRDAINYIFNPNISPAVNPIIGFTFLSGLGYYILKTIQYENLNSPLKFDKYIKENPGAIVLLELIYDRKGRISAFRYKAMSQNFRTLFNLNIQPSPDFDTTKVLNHHFNNSFDWRHFFSSENKKSIFIHFKHIDQSLILQKTHVGNRLYLCEFINPTSQTVELNREDPTKRISKIINAIPDIIFIIGDDGIFHDYITSDTELLSLSKKDIIGKSIFELGFSSIMANQIEKSIGKVLQNDGIETIEYGTELNNGRQCIFEMRIVKLNPSKVLSIGRDITQKKHYEEKLQEAKKLEEKANQLKSAFLSSLSHEIRTPMNAIIGFSELILNDTITNNDKVLYGKLINQNADQLLELVQDMISLSEIETNNLEIIMKPTKILHLVEKIFIDAENKLKTHENCNLSLKSNFSFDYQLSILTDENKLSIALQKLVENAIKFSQEGTILFQVLQRTKELQFSIIDQGIGIPANEIENIFHPFRQIETTSTKHFSGTGMGLAISNHFIKYIGGELKVMSVENKGTNFFFSLPLNQES